MRDNVRIIRGLSIALAAVLVACGHDTITPPPENASLIVTADLSGTTVASVVLEVTAADLPSGLYFNIPIVNSVASGTIALRAGSDRTITLRAYDAGGVQTHSGSVTVDVHSGTNATISIVMMPLTGDVPIQVTLGSYSVTVTASSSLNGIAVGGTVQLTAVVKDWNGNPSSAPVSWATADPSVATVDENGLVTGTGPGSTTIAATAKGATGTITAIVTP